MPAQAIQIRGTSELNAKLQAARRKIKDFTPYMNWAGVFMLGSVQKNFFEERAPDGAAWKRLKRPRRIRGGRGITRRAAGMFSRVMLARQGYVSAMTTVRLLRDTGRLFGSINFKATTKEMRLGTNVIYAAAHNFGFPPRNLPARTFMGFRDGDMRALIDRADLFILSRLSEARLV